MSAATGLETSKKPPAGIMKKPSTGAGLANGPAPAASNGSGPTGSGGGRGGGGGAPGPPAVTTRASAASTAAAAAAAPSTTMGGTGGGSSTNLTTRPVSNTRSEVSSRASGGPALAKTKAAGGGGGAGSRSGASGGASTVSQPGPYGGGGLSGRSARLPGGPRSGQARGGGDKAAGPAAVSNTHALLDAEHGVWLEAAGVGGLWGGFKDSVLEREYISDSAVTDRSRLGASVGVALVAWAAYVALQAGVLRVLDWLGMATCLALALWLFGLCAAGCSGYARRTLDVFTVASIVALITASCFFTGSDNIWEPALHVRTCATWFTLSGAGPCPVGSDGILTFPTVLVAPLATLLPLVLNVDFMVYCLSAAGCLATIVALEVVFPQVRDSTPWPLAAIWAGALVLCGGMISRRMGSRKRVAWVFSRRINDVRKLSNAPADLVDNVGTMRSRLGDDSALSAGAKRVVGALRSIQGRLADKTTEALVADVIDTLLKHHTMLPNDAADTGAAPGDDTSTDSKPAANFAHADMMPRIPSFSAAARQQKRNEVVYSQGRGSSHQWPEEPVFEGVVGKSRQAGSHTGFQEIGINASCVPSDPNVVAMLEDLLFWNFDIFELETLARHRCLAFVTYNVLSRFGLIQEYDLKIDKLSAFLNKVEWDYCYNASSPNPYHTNIHAADVVQAIACELVHDFRHPGVSSNYLINTASPLALRYNDMSVLEQYHVSEAFIVLQDDQFKFCEVLSQQDLHTFRYSVIQCVLSTDLSRGQEFISAFEAVRHQATFATEGPQKLLLLQMLIKAADVSHASREWSLHMEWSMRISEEFLRQGDQEKALRVPVSPLCDRDSHNLAKSQVGFIEFVALPCFTGLAEFCEMPQWTKQLTKNRNNWKARLDAPEGSRALTGSGSAQVAPTVSRRK